MGIVVTRRAAQQGKIAVMEKPARLELPDGVAVPFEAERHSGVQDIESS